MRRKTSPARPLESLYVTADQARATVKEADDVLGEGNTMPLAQDILHSVHFALASICCIYGSRDNDERYYTPIDGSAIVI